MKPKFIRKYLRMAKFMADDQPVCPSRQIGAIIVDPELNRIVGTGYNGPPPGTPHTDSRKYLNEYLWPQLTEDEIMSIGFMYGTGLQPDEIRVRFVNDCAGKKRCPRRILRVPSGRRMSLCSCGHAEVNAIINAAQNLKDCSLFLWETGPCVPCTHAIIMAKIKKIYCLEGDYYAQEAKWLLKQADVEITRYTKEWIFED